MSSYLRLLPPGLPRTLRADTLAIGGEERDACLHPPFLTPPQSQDLILPPPLEDLIGDPFIHFQKQPCFLEIVAGLKHSQVGLSLGLASYSHGGLPL